METELLCLKTADLNGTIGLENEEGFATDDSSGGSAYKQRYERASRELEYTKRRLQQQHHDDLEQLVALRKQLEKKVFILLIRYASIETYKLTVEMLSDRRPKNVRKYSYVEKNAKYVSTFYIRVPVQNTYFLVELYAYDDVTITRCTTG